VGRRGISFALAWYFRWGGQGTTLKKKVLEVPNLLYLFYQSIAKYRTFFWLPQEAKEGKRIHHITPQKQAKEKTQKHPILPPNL
jgi:hypothetical protein